jgi:trimeric autotransporter adhesin
MPAETNVRRILDMTILQSVAESFLHQWEGLGGNNDDLEQIVNAGNNNLLNVGLDSATWGGATGLTQTQFDYFESNYEIVMHYPNDDSGFSATVFKDRRTGEFVISFRSTEYQTRVQGGDWERDGASGADGDISSHGFALAQLDSMETFYTNIRNGQRFQITNNITGEGQWIDNPIIGLSNTANPSITVTGYSLGAHLSTAFTIMHPEARAFNFNAAGVGQINELVPNESSLTNLIFFYRALMNWDGRRETLPFSSLMPNLVEIFDDLGPWSDPLYEADGVNPPTLGITALLRELIIQARVDTLSLPYLGQHRAVMALLSTFTDGTIALGAQQQADALLSYQSSGFNPQYLISDIGEVQTEWANRITQLFGHGLFFDPQSVANSGYHSRPVFDFGIPTEDLPMSRGYGFLELILDPRLRNLVGDWGETHSITPTIDSLTIIDLLQQIDPSFTVQSFSAILSAASNRIEHVNTPNAIDAAYLGLQLASVAGDRLFDSDALENIVNVLSRVFLGSNHTDIVGDYDNPEGFALRSVRELMHSRIEQISVLLSGSNASMQVVSLAGLSAADIASRAQNDIAYRYALQNLDSFVIAGSGSQALYAQHNSNAELDNFSEQYLADRAALLSWRLQYDSGAEDYDDNYWRAAAYNLSSNSLTLPVLSAIVSSQLGDKPYSDDWDSDSVVGDWDYIAMGASNQDANGDGLRDDIRFTIDGTDESWTDLVTTTINHVIAFGDDRANTLTGGNNSDRLYGAGGDDILISESGNDRLEGGEGFDEYRIGKGNDVILDSDGRGSVLWFAANNFIVRGISGVSNPVNDWIKINDTTYYDRQNYVTYQLKPNDDGTVRLVIISPSRTNSVDTITIEDFHEGDLGISLGSTAPTQPVAQLITDGPDVYGQTALTYGLQHSVNGLAGNDLLSGGGEDDYLAGGAGDDVLIGELGNDILDGGDGNDFFFEGFFAASATQEALSPEEELIAQAALIRGQNWYVTLEGSIYRLRYENVRLGGDSVSPEAESDIVLAGNGNDVAWLGVGNDFADGGDGNDYIEGGQDHDTVMGGAGNDRIWGDDPNAYGNEQFIRNGNDVLFGDAGEDTIVGNGGNDVINGGADNDFIFGDNGDTINAQVSLEEQVTGEDYIYAGSGDDTAHGGGGVDIIFGEAGNDRIYGDNAIIGQLELHRNFDGNDEIHGGDGNDIIGGMGGNDTIYGDAGDDTILGDHESIAAANGGNDVIYGGAGNDGINGNGGNDRIDGGDGMDDLSGNEGDDTITGGAGNDIVVGNDGNDILDGGLGNDSMRGDAGNDIYLINGAWGRDGIFGLDDSNAGQDIIRFGAGINPEDMKIALTEDGVFLYRDADNVIKLEGFMSGNHRIEFAGRTVWTAQTLIDNLIQQLRDEGIVPDNLALGGGSSDQVVGTSGVDVGYGFASSDVMSGADGNDILSGGEGDDTINGDAGNDTLHGGLNNDIIHGGDGRDQLLGGAGNDILSGDGGNDYLSGGEGEDVLTGGQGSDSLNGGAGVDSYHFAAGFGNDTVLNLGGTDGLNDTITFAYDVAASSLIYLQDNDSLIIQVEGTPDLLRLDDFFAAGANHTIRFANGVVLQQNQVQNLLLVENTSPNPTSIYGTAGIDRLVGGIGNDVIDGDLGNDTIIGYAGDDIIHGGPEDNGFGSSATDNDTLYGGEGNDELYGRRGNDRLEGGNGDDLLIGGGGQDTLIGDAGNDTIRDGFILVDNVLVDEVSNDFIKGGLGNDSMRGGLGTNTYRFGANFGQDQIYLANAPAGVSGFNHETAVIEFSTEISASDISISRTSENLIINHGINSITLVGYRTSLANVSFQFMDGSRLSSQQLLGTSSFSGTNLDDHLFGTYRDDQLYGLGGNDILDGSRGNDLLDGDAGDDTLNGGFGADNLIGGSGNDILNSGEIELRNWLGLLKPYDEGSNDRLEGGSGNDQLTGGLGTNIYRFANGFGQDTINLTEVGSYGLVGLQDETAILSFSLGIAASSISFLNIGDDLVVTSVADRITIKNYYGYGVYGGTNLVFVFDDGSQLSATQIQAMNTRVGSDTDDFIQGTPRNDLFLGMAGNDIFYGYAGDDVIEGGTGNDELGGFDGNDIYIFNAGDGIDRILDGAGINTLRLGTGILPDDIQVVSSAGESLHDIEYGLGRNELTDAILYLRISGTSDSIQLATYGDDGRLVLSISRLEFANGVVWDQNELNRRLDEFILLGTLNSDTIIGSDRDEVIYGLSGDDLLTAGSGNDSVIGGYGNDILDGGLGADILYGGVDDDTYIVDNVGDVIDEVFGSGIDSVQSSISYTLATGIENLTLTGLANINATGSSQDNLLVGNAANNTLNGRSGNDTMIGGTGNDIYVIDAVDDVVIESMNQGIDLVQSNITYSLGNDVENLTLTGSEIINGTGNALDNVLFGNSANNILSGGAGNDALSGGIGNDTMLGGAGNDTYVVNSTGDVVTEATNEGTDLVQSAVTYTIGNNVENLTLTGSSVINATGNTLDNILIGNSANNALTAGDGNDTLNGGSGTDTLVGGLGNDVYIVDTTTDVITENATSGTDTVQSSVSFSLAAIAFNNVENLTLTGTATTAVGNVLNNVLTGNSANNTLSGGAGSDTMIGGAGNDTYVVDATGDVITELNNEGTDVVQSSVTYTLANNIENITLTGTTAINAMGNALDNVLTGNSANNTLTGGVGNDTLNGGTGNDTMIGGAGNDIFVVNIIGDVVTEIANEGTDTVQSGVTYTLGNNVENLTLTGTTAINGTGNALDNVLVGNSANNTLTGGAGNDTLDGGTGNDTMVGGAGNDTFVVNITGDIVTELANEGTDTVQSAITYTLGTNLENLTLTGTTAINGTGNTANNVMTGNSANNTLSGGAGNDTLYGGQGSDILIGGAGVNQLYGNEGNDTLSSDAASTGGSSYEGGTGNDIMTGGQQNDTYRFNIGDGQDTITDAGLVGVTDTISFGAGITSVMLQFSRVGNNLLIAVNGNTDTITINSWYSNALNQLEQINFADGSSINGSQLQALTSITLLRTPTSTLNTESLSSEQTASSAFMTDGNDMPRLQNIQRFSSQALLDQMQTLNELVGPSYASSVAWIRDLHYSEALRPEMAVADASSSNIDVIASLQTNARTMMEDRMQRRFERQSRFERGAFGHRYHEQELDVLIESMSRFADQNTAVDAVKPGAIDQLQPIAIVPPSI